MPENAATAGPSASEAVEELLRQLVDARFVLTDRDGAVTRWSRPAEELFGWPGARMLGRPLVETLELGIELPDTGGRVNAIARRQDGQELELALTFVPVRMSQSLEFNGFLEALEIAAPRGDALGQQLLVERAARLDALPGEKLHAVSHCLLAHHGAESLPGRRFRSAEALALFRLNALDAGVKGALEHGLA